jgi:hypothetical protein
MEALQTYSVNGTDGHIHRMGNYKFLTTFVSKNTKIRLHGWEGDGSENSSEVGTGLSLIRGDPKQKEEDIGLIFAERVEYIGKAIHVTGHGGPQGCETLRVPQYLDQRFSTCGPRTTCGPRR